MNGSNNEHEASVESNGYDTHGNQRLHESQSTQERIDQARNNNQQTMNNYQDQEQTQGLQHPSADVGAGQSEQGDRQSSTEQQQQSMMEGGGESFSPERQHQPLAVPQQEEQVLYIGRRVWNFRPANWQEIAEYSIRHGKVKQQSIILLCFTVPF